MEQQTHGDFVKLRFLRVAIGSGISNPGAKFTLDFWEMRLPGI
jgi:hypothetical protein